MTRIYSVYFAQFWMLSCVLGITFAEIRKNSGIWSVNGGKSDSTFKIFGRFRRSVQEVYDFADYGLEDVAVNVHNEARRTVDPTAADMREMSWDSELAAIALAYSQDCVFQHNPSPTHSRFQRSGENLFVSSGINFDADYVRNALEDWDEERIDYNYETMGCTPDKPCGHYTQMVWASTFKVGCGASKCSSIVVSNRLWRDATLLVCNYGPAGNFRGQRPYLSGLPCDSCEDPNDVCSVGLCSNPSRIDNPSSANWLEWSRWGECSASCGGNGRRYRNRDCSTYVLTDCSGFSRQFDPYCADKECPEGGATLTTTPTTTTSSSSGHSDCADWSTWSSCSVSCGQGESRRSQVCVRQEGRVTYTETKTQIQHCQRGSCSTGDLSSGWDAWSPWSPCSNLCGSGLRIRSRICGSPPCQGSSYEVIPCSSTELC